MTERKPAGMSFTSWVDKQIHDAEESGRFDDLPGAGKPIPRREGSGFDIWLRDYMKREGADVSDILPAPLKLKREKEHLAERLGGIRSEAKVIEQIDDLNQRIKDWRKYPTGPPIHVPLVDKEAQLGIWRAGRAESSASRAEAAEVKPARRRFLGWLGKRS